MLTWLVIVKIDRGRGAIIERVRGEGGKVVEIVADKSVMRHHTLSRLYLVPCTLKLAFDSRDAKKNYHMINSRCSAFLGDRDRNRSRSRNWKWKWKWNNRSPGSSLPWSRAVRAGFDADGVPSISFAIQNLIILIGNRNYRRFASFALIVRAAAQGYLGNIIHRSFGGRHKQESVLC